MTYSSSSLEYVYVMGKYGQPHGFGSDDMATQERRKG